jgi:putative transposase
MGRPLRIEYAGALYHITSRGNEKKRIFLEDADRIKFLEMIEDYHDRYGILMHSYVLMDNHVHLLVRPLEEKDLSKMMQGITLCYTQYFNRKYRRTGRLWECRYHSTIIDEDKYLWTVSRYIEDNPVRVGVVKKAEDYRYSSAKAHFLGARDALLRESLFDKRELIEYKKFIKMDEEKGILEEIREQTRLGKPLGDGGFLEALSKQFGRMLVFRPKGRPKKAIIE